MATKARLVDIAKTVKSRALRVKYLWPEDQLLELTIEWFLGNITYSQVVHALWANADRKSGGKAYVVLATTLSDAIKRGNVQLVNLSNLRPPDVS